MFDIFCAIAPVFLTILAGMIIEKLEVLPKDFHGMLGVLVANICMPCLIFHILINLTPEQFAYGRWWLVTCAIQFTAGAVIFHVARRGGSAAGDAVITAFGGAFANAAFVGLPIVMNYLPGNKEALMVCGLALVTTNAILLPGLAVLDVASKKGRRGASMGVGAMVWDILRRYFLSNYTLVATAIGLVIALCGIPVWAPLDKTASSIGFLGPACMMISLGMSLSEKLTRALGHGGRSGLLRHQLWLLLWKLILVPLATFLVLVAVGCEGLWVGVAVIILGSSTATVTAVYADIYRALPEEAALNVVVSTITGLGTLAVWIWALRHLGYLG